MLKRPRLADAGVQVSQEALDPQALGLDGRTQILLQFQALTDERRPLGAGAGETMSCAHSCAPARIAGDHVAAHAANDNSWAAMAGGILATLCALGAVLMLGRAVVPGRWRRAFWLFPPLWLDKELDT